MDVTILIAHEIEIGEGDRDRLCADSQEAANIDNDLTTGACPMNVINLADLMVVGAVNGCAFQNSWCEFGSRETNVIAVIHRDFLVWLKRQENTVSGELFHLVLVFERHKAEFIAF